MTHLSLRPFTHGDAEAILGSAPRPAEWADDYPSAPDVEIAGLLASGTFALATPAEPWGPWVVLLPDGTPVGGCGFHGPPVDGVAEIGYHVSPSHQGRGLERLSRFLLGEPDGRQPPQFVIHQRQQLLGR